MGPCVRRDDSETAEAHSIAPDVITHYALVHAPRAGDLFHRAHPAVDLAIFGRDQDVIDAGIAIGAKPCAELRRVLAIEADAQRDGEGLVRPRRAESLDHRRCRLGGEAVAVPAVAELHGALKGPVGTAADPQ